MSIPLISFLIYFLTHPTVCHFPLYHYKVLNFVYLNIIHLKTADMRNHEIESNCGVSLLKHVNVFHKNINKI